ncbi:MAG: bifunctional metallophosphatase/5'-nucleotidase [Lachnospiraceae bacterium]|nr:bifunctional metallophosphatase/5'-nucleotidase [Lachnospiraceae bacterium]
MRRKNNAKKVKTGKKCLLAALAMAMLFVLSACSKYYVVDENTPFPVEESGEKVSQSSLNSGAGTASENKSDLTGPAEETVPGKDSDSKAETDLQPGSDGGEATDKPAIEDIAEEKQDVTILYTNDVHTYIANTGKDEEGNTFRLLNYSSVAAYKQELIAEGENVLLVDAGDFSQGSAYGAMDEGATIVELMNNAGYNLATFGNHEFDYGQFRALSIMNELAFPVISCNFYNTSDQSPVLKPYEIVEIAGNKIAFIGISTPETITKSTPVYFQNEKGEYIYNFFAGTDGQELYDCVQQTIDEVRGQVDYVIALGHLGVDTSSEPYTSRLVIANTTGLDAFIDGHSHTTIEGELVTDKSGRNVVLTQTGSYFAAIGRMTISNGSIKTELVKDYDKHDEAVAAIEDAWIASVDERLGEQIAVLDQPMYITDPDDPAIRIVRNHETNLGDFNADSIYYYFNELAGLDCDFAIVNGGGIRATVEAGEYSYLSSKMISPFGNVICLVEITGQQLLDVLEKTSMSIGLIDSNTGKAAESGGFMQVAGLSYTIDCSVESTVAVDENDLWLAPPTGEYKVKDVMVYNRETGSYEPLELEKTYSIGGSNYLLRNQGSGLTMLSDLRLIQDYVGEDYMVLSDYAKSFAGAEDGYAHISTATCPLASYEGYLLDYENPYGSGRITIK